MKKYLLSIIAGLTLSVFTYAQSGLNIGASFGFPYESYSGYDYSSPKIIYFSSSVISRLIFRSVKLLRLPFITCFVVFCLLKPFCALFMYALAVFCCWLALSSLRGDGSSRASSGMDV